MKFSPHRVVAFDEHRLVRGDCPMDYKFSFEHKRAAEGFKEALGLPGDIVSIPGVYGVTVPHDPAYLNKAFDVLDGRSAYKLRNLINRPSELEFPDSSLPMTQDRLTQLRETYNPDGGGFEYLAVSANTEVHTTILAFQEKNMARNFAQDVRRIIQPDNPFSIEYQKNSHMVYIETSHVQNNLAKIRGIVNPKSPALKTLLSTAAISDDSLTRVIASAATERVAAPAPAPQSQVSNVGTEAGRVQDNSIGGLKKG